MKGRKIVSLTLLFSMIFLILTSIVLYIVPHGRVAYWSNWTFWGIDKTEWTNFHINIGMLFVILIFIHTYYNWRAIKSYLKKSGKVSFLTKESIVSIFLVILVILGTFFHIPPFGTFLDLGEKIKDSATEKYGEPPYGHAELSTLKEFSKKTKNELAVCLEKLHNAGVTCTQNQTLKEIAEKNNKSPKDLYRIITER